MKSHDKAFLISGMMFNAIFFLAMMLNIFVTNALAFAMVASAVSYLFFDKLYYAQKKTDTHANE
ncbi:hypothetical protein [Staphylococcus haemolyticus]|uniref:hypothetical protein n=1 Tax=Staphylococcus haemolyticus TaxID=1283 RepID=UPI001F0B5475|nr:hypothetical protein [Staphylococcus haemolyticus]MCH4385784.1 hypothetical protein [Staphylococcus haemolyticus]